MLSSDSNNRTAAAAGPAASGRPAVLFALTEEERRMYFPEGWSGQVPGGIHLNVLGLSVEDWRRHLVENRPAVVVSGWTTPPLPLEALLSGGGSLAYLCHVAGSLRHVIRREHLERGLLATNWGGLVAPIVAEHALLLVLAGLRNLPAWRPYLGQPLGERAKKSVLGTRTLFGKRVAVFGLGAVARELARLLRPFDVSLAAWSPGVPESLYKECGVARAASLEELCTDAEVLVLCEALKPETRGAVDASVLGRLREGAVVVNVGRGALADEAALAGAALQGGIRLALDVACSDPLPPDSPLLAIGQALVSPHIGGPTHDFFPTCGRRALGNVVRHLAGGCPDGLISPEAFDRAT